MSNQKNLLKKVLKKCTLLPLIFHSFLITQLGLSRFCLIRTHFNFNLSHYIITFAKSNKSCSRSLLEALIDIVQYNECNLFFYD